MAAAAASLSACSTDATGSEAAFPKSRAEAFQQTADCMKAQGWKVIPSPDSIQGSYDPSQQSAYLKALDECEKGRFPDPAQYSEKDQKGAYAAAVKTYECLAAHNQPVGQKLSLQAFVDQGSHWNPYSAINDTQPLTNSTLEQLEKLCPQPTYWPKE